MPLPFVDRTSKSIKLFPKVCSVFLESIPFDNNSDALKNSQQTGIVYCSAKYTESSKIPNKRELFIERQ